MNTKIYGSYKNNILKASGLRYLHNINKTEYKTIPELFIKSCKYFKNNNSLGYREILKKKEYNNNLKYKLGKYNWITYEELFLKSKNFGCGIRSICNLKQKNKICIYANTKKEWFISANGCLLQNYTIVTCYSNLGTDALIHSLNQTKSKVIIIDYNQIAIISKIKQKCIYLKYAIIIPEYDSKDTYVDENSLNLKCYMYDEIINYGENSNIISLPKQSNIAFIMYTSGSTGVPKGVKLSHKNLVVSIYGIQERVMLTDKDTYLAYLPLAHILELLAEYVCIFNGSKIGYGSPNTLTNKSNKIMKNTKGDAVKLNPTIIAFVPLILDKIKYSIVNKIEKSPNYIKNLYNTVYNSKKEIILKYGNLKKFNGQNGILNIIKKCLGNNLRSILSGGAPLHKDTIEFFNICFDINMLQGYGLTETCGTGSISCLDHYNHTTVGPPLINNYIKIIDWVEGEYFVKNNKGEICIGGDNVSCGYYKNNKENDKFFIENGIRWFKTGDIGLIHNNGTLQIIDRKKDIVKMSTGEYLSYSKIENILKQSKFIENCMCYVNEKYTDRPLCIISVTDTENKFTPIRDLTEKSNKSTILKDLCNDNKIKSIVEKELNDICKNNKLKKFEIPIEFRLSHISWNVENDLITSSYKLKRKNIVKYYSL